MHLVDRALCVLVSSTGQRSRHLAFPFRSGSFGVLAFAALDSDQVSPFTIPALLGNTAAGVIAIETGAQGPNFGIVSACATATHCLGEALQAIREGEVLLLCGVVWVWGLLAGWLAAACACVSCVFMAAASQWRRDIHVQLIEDTRMCCLFLELLECKWSVPDGLLVLNRPACPPARLTLTLLASSDPTRP